MKKIYKIHIEIFFYQNTTGMYYVRVTELLILYTFSDSMEKKIICFWIFELWNIFFSLSFLI